jgi:dTDP-4-dehydrorhamnose reductase
VILVFGAGGQLGQEILARAAARSIPVLGVTHQQADIADPAGVGRAIGAARPSIVVNAAAYNAVDRAEREPEAAFRVNADGPGVLARACSRSGLALVHISTDYVFGARPGPHAEQDATAPLNAYGRSKKAGEEAVRVACRQHLILRTAWLFGSYGTNFLKTYLRLAATQDELRIVADQWGSPTWTGDLADAIFSAAEACATGDERWGTYHVAGSAPASRFELAAHIVHVQAALTGRRPAVVPISAAQYSAPAPRPSNSVLDSSKFAASFGLRPGDWRTAVDRLVPQLIPTSVGA